MNFSMNISHIRRTPNITYIYIHIYMYNYTTHRRRVSISLCLLSSTIVLSFKKPVLNFLQVAGGGGGGVTRGGARKSWAAIKIPFAPRRRAPRLLWHMYHKGAGGGYEGVRDGMGGKIKGRRIWVYERVSLQRSPPGGGEGGGLQLGHVLWTQSNTVEGYRLWQTNKKNLADTEHKNDWAIEDYDQ